MNTLEDLNNSLFDSLSKLDKSKDIEKEIKKGLAKSQIADKIIQLNKLKLDTAKTMIEYYGRDRALKSVNKLIGYEEDKGPKIN